MIWHDMTWHDMICYDMIWCDMMSSAMWYEYDPLMSVHASIQPARPLRPFTSSWCTATYLYYAQCSPNLACPSIPICTLRAACMLPHASCTPPAGPLVDPYLQVYSTASGCAHVRVHARACVRALVRACAACVAPGTRAPPECPSRKYDIIW